MIFKSKEEAIIACQSQCQEAWEEFHDFIVANNKTMSPVAADRYFKIAKNVFVTGFMRGAEFVTSAVINKSIETPITSSKI